MTVGGLSDRLSLRFWACREAGYTFMLHRVCLAFRWAFRRRRGARKHRLTARPVFRKAVGMVGPAYALEFRVSPSVGIHRTRRC